MQKFFFHMVYDSTTTEDPEGSDLPDLDTAYAEAKGIIRDLAAEHLKMDSLFRLKRVRISSQAGRVLAEVSAAEGIREIIPPCLFAENPLPQA